MAARAAAPFRVGQNELYMPNFALTLLRTPSQPANVAKFKVPLWFSKLDLRDYLFHVYNVRIFSVRSYVKQARIQEGTGRTPMPEPNRWHRPRSTKYMTVELERPFVWPKQPEDLSPWNKAEREESSELEKEMTKMSGSLKDTYVNEERRKAMREQAKELLEGKVRWKSLGNKQSGSLLSR